MVTLGWDGRMVSIFASIFKTENKSSIYLPLRPFDWWVGGWERGKTKVFKTKNNNICHSVRLIGGWVGGKTTVKNDPFCGTPSTPLVSCGSF